MTESKAMRFIGQAVIESEKALEVLQSIKSEAERIGKIGEYYANLDNCVKEIEACRVAIQALEEIQAYRAIGAVEDFKALKEKNEPKEVAYQIDTSGHKHEKCPACGSFHVFGKHCTECGQSIIEWWQ